MQDTPQSRRRQQRFHCLGGVELRRDESTPPVYGNLSDVSLTGCYVHTVSTFPVGTELLVLLRVQETVVRGRAKVRTSHHAVGIGLVFHSLSHKDHQQLEFLVGTLAGTQDLVQNDLRQNDLQQNDLNQNSDRNDQRMSMTEDTLPALRPLSEATVPPVSGGAPSDMSAEITRTINELNQVEQRLVIDKVDPRIIAQFHDAVEHIRQTAWSAVQWVDLHSIGGDPFEVLPQLEAERMHMLRKLAHNVTADLDSGSLNRFTGGIAEVYEVVNALYRGLRRIVIDPPEDR